MQKKAVFLDRDGTINVDFGYVYNPDKLVFIDGVEASLKKLQDAGYLLIIVTNQSGIGRGYFSEKEANKFNEYLVKALQQVGVSITDIFMCPHSPEDKCDCRKPSPKLVNDAIKKYDIDPNQSYMLGDKQSDVDCGHNAGVMSFLINKEYIMDYWVTQILNKK